MNLRTLITIEEFSPFLELINFLYLIILILLMIVGYILQYMSCFRRDRGFCYQISHSKFLQMDSSEKVLQEDICYGSALFSFIIPSTLHFIGYLHANSVMRNSDDDLLPQLMERVILSSNGLSNSFYIQRKLVRTLWAFVFISLIWMLLSFISTTVMVVEGEIYFKWLAYDRSSSVNTTLKVLLVASILWHDAIKAIIISNYCLQAQLLTSYLHFLREHLLQYCTEPIKWMREIEDFKKLLKYLNNDVAPSICIFTIINIAYAFSGILWFFNFDSIDKETVPIIGISVFNIILWVSISIVPFIQAVRLTSACENLKEVGQEVRVRPFVHSNTPRSELDSLLLYTSALNIGAKLYNNVITGSQICLCFVLLSIVFLVLGMCHYLNY